MVKTVTITKKPLESLKGPEGNIWYVFATQGRHSRSPLKVATQGRHSRWPLKVATQGGHCMLTRSLDIHVFALYIKNATCYKKNAWDPLRDVRGTYGIFFATQGGHSRSPLKVAIQGRHSRWPLYVKTVTRYTIVRIIC